jgi:hypothetical protein
VVAAGLPAVPVLGIVDVLVLVLVPGLPVLVLVLPETGVDGVSARAAGAARSKTSAAAEAAPATAPARAPTLRCPSSAPTVRARSSRQGVFDHDSVANPFGEMSTVARRTRSLRFPATDHGSAIFEEETLTCANRARSPRSRALDHDSVAMESEMLEGAAKRVRSSRSRALDHDAKELREPLATGARSTGSACSPDHVPAAKPLVTPFPTGKSLPRCGYSSMKFRGKIARKFFSVQEWFLYQKTSGRRPGLRMYTKSCKPHR